MMIIILVEEQTPQGKIRHLRKIDSEIMFMIPDPDTISMGLFAALRKMLNATPLGCGLQVLKDLYHETHRPFRTVLDE